MRKIKGEFNFNLKMQKKEKIANLEGNKTKKIT